jgi:hypothetical protein
MSDTPVNEIREVQNVAPSGSRTALETKTTNANALAIIEHGHGDDTRKVLAELADTNSSINPPNINLDAKDTGQNLPKSESELSVETIDQFILDYEQVAFKTDFIKVMDEVAKKRPRLSFGPVFSMTDRNERKLSLSVMQMGENSYSLIDKPNNIRFTYLIIAEDDNGEIVGYKNCFLNNNIGGPDLIAHGFIHNAQKGSGVASCIESANQAYLGSTARKIQKNINIEVKDRNQIDLDSIKKDNLKTPNPVLARMIERKTLEHDSRWLAVYGPGGSQGFDESRHKILNKDGFQYIPDRSLITLNQGSQARKPVNIGDSTLIEESVLQKNLDRWLNIASSYKLKHDADEKRIVDNYQKLTGLTID